MDNDKTLTKNRPNAVTAETRNEAFNSLDLGPRQKAVYNALSSPMTANELAQRMWRQLRIHDSERNKVHPRLTELVAMGHVAVVGKRQCSVSGRKCALYERTATAITSEALRYAN